VNKSEVFIHSLSPRNFLCGVILSVAKDPCTRHGRRNVRDPRKRKITPPLCHPGIFPAIDGTLRRRPH